MELDLSPLYKKKFTPIKIGTQEVDREKKVDLSYGHIEGPYYDEERPKTEFDTEDDAISYAINKDKYALWIIVPLIIPKI